MLDGTFFDTENRGRIQTQIAGCGHQGIISNLFWGIHSVQTDASGKCYIEVITHMTEVTSCYVIIETFCNYCVFDKRVLYKSYRVPIPANTSDITIKLKIDPFSINANDPIVGSC
jgi:hypothetical protein